MANRVFILGASDPEMRRIDEVLHQMGCRVRYATKDGKPVHPGNAYQADAMGDDILFQEIILVECQPGDLPDGAEIIRVDHHREDDPGYGLPASEFWQASSLGHIFALLGITATQDDLILAAMDHCPAAAIRGECPGVTAEEVIERKVAEIAAATKSSPEQVWIRIAFYAEEIKEAPFLSVSMEGGMLMDMREFYLGEGYSLDLLAAQVAALAEGYSVLLRHRDAAGKPEKWSISGHASPEMIEGFMKFWAPSQGLVGIYGVPSRGYAGGYLPQEN